jgi:hypothetical protein
MRYTFEISKIEESNLHVRLRTPRANVSPLSLTALRMSSNERIEMFQSLSKRIPAVKVEEFERMSSSSRTGPPYTMPK